MNNQIFRQKSVERISSPEQLQDYMRVTSPGIWMVLAAVILLLAGLIASSALATLEDSVPARGVVADDGGDVVMELPLSQKDVVAPGMTVRVADRDARVEYIYQDEESLRVVATLDDADKALPGGVYDVEIVTERLTPISFLLN